MIAIGLGAILVLGAGGPPSGEWLICIGQRACANTETASCSVALGDDVDLPTGSRNVIVTRDGRGNVYMGHLSYIDASVATAIVLEAIRVVGSDETWGDMSPERRVGQLSQFYRLDWELIFKNWNAACSPRPEPLS